jgi:hypothetical protein
VRPVKTIRVKGRLAAGIMPPVESPRYETRDGRSQSNLRERGGKRTRWQKC